MFTNKHKALFAGILTGAVIMIGLGNSALAAEEVRGGTQTASTNGLYGTDKPDTKEELCAFLDGKLNSNKVLAPKAAHRYQKDFDLHCTETEDATFLRSAAPEAEIDWSEYPSGLRIQQYGKSIMTSFLRNASSGMDAIIRSNNIETLFGQSADE